MTVQPEAMAFTMGINGALAIGLALAMALARVMPRLHNWQKYPVHLGCTIVDSWTSIVDFP